MARTSEEDIKKVEELLEELSGYFDEVQIFATRYSPKGNETITTYRGKGNFYARYGIVKQWILYEEERQRQRAREDAIREAEDKEEEDED